jgi:RNA polymerase sigma-70 factor, ECF subfamily
MHRIEASRYVDDLYRYAMVLVHNHAEADDLVQETYLRAFKAMSRLRQDSNLKAWLFAILRNVWLNQLRQRHTAPGIVEFDADEVDIVVETSKDPHHQYVSKLEREHVREAIQQLPVEFREIVILREYDELSYQEIAALVGCPAGTVMSRLARARSRLRILLSPFSQPSDPVETAVEPSLPAAAETELCGPAK